MAEIEIEGKKFVVISKDEYDSMARDVDWLVCLQAAGVDNWSGIEYAIQLRGGDDDEEDE